MPFSLQRMMLMYLQKEMSIKTFLFASKVMKRAGSGSGSASVSHKYGSEDPDPHPDPYQNVTDP
jgi:hypothetical protein